MRDIESDFLQDYRRAGLKWIYAAGIAVISIFATLFVVSIYRGEVLGGINVYRFFVCCFILTVLLALRFAQRHFFWLVVPLVALGSLGAFSGTMLIALLAEKGAFGPAVAIPIALNFGLFLHYCFLRLPLVVSALIGWSASILILMLTSSAFASDLVRHAVYLAFANIFGMVLCKLIENRERELFFLRRQAESARLEASKRRAEAEEAVALKDRLIAAVGHDLRQPMTAAALHLGVVAQRLDAADIQGARAQVDKAGQAMSSLGGTLEHLLTSARYDGGAAPMQPEWLDLKDTLSSLIDNVLVLARHRDVLLRVRIPSVPLQIRTDRVAFERMISNLADNALKYAKPRGSRPARVLIAVRARADRALIEFIDTGPGITMESSSRIWEPYTRIEHSAADRTPGLGLGLFLVRRMSEQLPEHRVRMHSLPGRGSRFTLELPARRVLQVGTEAATGGSSADVPDAASLWGACVLLIEDDRDVRLSLEQLLTEWGVIVLAAPSLQQAQVTLADSERLVDAVISDYHLPGPLSGLQVLGSLRSSLGYSFGAIVVTGDSDLARIHAQAGRDTIVLRKPLSAHLLLAPLVRAVAVGAARAPSPV